VRGLRTSVRGPRVLFQEFCEELEVAKSQSFDRLLWKAADRIHNRLKPGTVPLTDLLLPETPWLYWQVCLRRIRKAGSRKWTGAVERVRQEARNVLTELIDRLQGCRTALAPGGDRSGRDRSGVSSVGEIYRDLLSLRDEFPQVALEFSSGSVSVTTEPIVLDEVYLGPFEIKLDWTDAWDPLRYEVLACDPHPASSSDGVTHPHVEADRLCEGDGSPVIRQALRQGRLADFFLIVRQILEMYNSGSAYIPLDQWSGRECPDCGDHYDEDDFVRCGECESAICDACRRDCQSCESSFCGECLSICSRCSDQTCNGCLQTCSGCDEPLCGDCLESCSRCNSTRCEDCLNEGLCSDCCSQTKETDPPQTPNTGTDAVPDTPDTALQPLRVGEAAVSA